MTDGMHAAAALQRVARIEGGRGLVSEQLHALLYYAQGITYADGSPLFEGRFLAATHGPVLEELATYIDLNHYDWNAGLSKLGRHLDGVCLDRLREVYLVLGDLSSSSLSNAAKAERPWQRAREGLAWFDPSMPPIPDMTIREYFSDLIEFAEDAMTDLGLGALPGRPAWASQLRLGTNLKFLTNHPLFDEREARRMRAALGFSEVPEDWSDYQPVMVERSDQDERASSLT